MQSGFGFKSLFSVKKRSRNGKVFCFVGDAAEEFDVSAQFSDLLANDLVEFDDVVVFKRVMDLLLELLVDAALEAMEALEIGFVGLEDAIVQDFKFGAAEFAQFFLTIAIPLDEGWFGDADGFGNFGEAVAFQAEFEEFVFCFVGMHMCLVVSCLQLIVNFIFRKCNKVTWTT